MRNDGWLERFVAVVPALARRGAIVGAALLVAHVAKAQGAASDDGLAWLPWIVVGAIAFFVLALVLRMILAARFPRGYRAWAKSRRDAFAERNEAWDRADEDFRR